MRHRWHIEAMRGPIFGIAILVAAVAPESPPSAKAGQLNFKNSLLDWHVGWPAEVSAIPALLASIRDPAIRNKGALLKTAAADKAERTKSSFPFFAYESSIEIAVAGSTPRLLSLTDDVSEFTGGAHPNHGTSAILWDRSLGRKITFDSQFINGASSVAALLRKPYCSALDKERAKRRGPEQQAAGSPGGDPFNQCPKFSDLALIPEGKSARLFSTVTIHADPYVAGPYAEGDYDISLPVTAAQVAAVKPQYRSSFAPAR